MMFKLLILGRRKAGLSPEELIERFEHHHIPLNTELAVSGKIAPMIK